MSEHDVAKLDIQELAAAIQDMRQTLDLIETIITKALLTEHEREHFTNSKHS